jgi:molecular chaperone GrpE
MSENRDPETPEEESPKSLEEADSTAAEEEHGEELPANFLDEVVADATSDTPTQLRQELSEANTRLLRTQAEMDNIRKRTQRELADERKYAAMPLLRDLVGVVDNLHRALQAADAEGPAAELSAGVQMVADEMAKVLQQHHCVAVPGAGAVFDPNVHEALAQQPSDEFPAGTVMLVHQVGYRLHDRVVRPAQVIVSTGPAQP